ncbi:ArsA-related P-loop ATPase [uncultured Mailhella sp.]|uniref:ParA family protein n=1 Tax=uncultured Mailhella sp. TaxID=1981031 RepID=UPI0025F84E8C|nr:ArsA-related P-loop ATPase [uncultured Mailhella sp.]
MARFDDLMGKLEEIFLRHDEALHLGAKTEFFFVNRDLFGRISLVMDEERFGGEKLEKALSSLREDIAETLAPHVLPDGRALFFRSAPFAEEKQGAVVFRHEGRFSFTVVDRVLTESSWAARAEEDELSRKTAVFFSIKGGVGRSTALAAAAWYLAKKGKTVMVVDMDLESPGLSSSLLPEERRPEYGLLDWLVEDAVGNGDAVIESMVATSPLTEGSGEIFVVPAHGRKEGEYIAKMGRAWMPRMEGDVRVSWPQRLRSLLEKLDGKYGPDCILIDSRAGLDEIASACVLGLAPGLVLLFALEGVQTWTGYSMLFRYWNELGRAAAVRESLQVVAAMLPPVQDKPAYARKLRENAWNVFSASLYDDVPAPGDASEQTESALPEPFNFDLEDEEAPHHPWIIHWNQGLSAMEQLYTLDHALDEAMMKAVFPFIDNLYRFFFEEEA